MLNEKQVSTLGGFEAQPFQYNVILTTPWPWDNSRTEVTVSSVEWLSLASAWFVQQQSVSRFIFTLHSSSGWLVHLGKGAPSASAITALSSSSRWAVITSSFVHLFFFLVCLGSPFTPFLLSLTIYFLILYLFCFFILPCWTLSFSSLFLVPFPICFIAILHTHYVCGV